MSFDIEQLVSHIGIILQHGHEIQFITGMLLRTSFEYYAVEAGLPGDPLQLPYLSYTSHNTWVGSTIKSMRKYNITIKSNLPGLASWTSDDVYIMQQLASTVTSTKILAILNKVRMYLRVVTLLDIISADGKTYDVNILHGHRGTCNPNPSYYRSSWPNIQTPTKMEKEVWYQYICLTFNILPASPN